MSKELIEQLAKEHLKRGEVIADHEGYGAFVVTPNGEFVRYEDVSKMLEAYAQTQWQSIPPECLVTRYIHAPDIAYDEPAVDKTRLTYFRLGWNTCANRLRELNAAPIESGVKG